MISVTRLVDFLLFGRLFKACGNGFLAQIVYIIGRFLKKCHFSSESIFGQLFIDIGQLLTQAFWSPWLEVRVRSLPTSISIHQTSATTKVLPNI